MIWGADRGFASAADRAYAAAALARPGRYRTVAGNLRVQQVTVAPGGAGDGDEGARAQRFMVCHDPNRPNATSRPRPPGRTPAEPDRQAR